MRHPSHGHKSAYRRTGFTLLEMLVVMWSLTIVMGLGSMLLVTAMRTEQVCAATLRGLSWRAELADQFRADVARAAAAPEQIGELTRGPACLILRTPDGNHVIYQWHEGLLEHIVRGGAEETRRPLPLGSEDMSVEFESTPGDRPLFTLRIVEPLTAGVVRRSDVSAALGGDLR